MLYNLPASRINLSHDRFATLIKENMPFKYEFLSANGTILNSKSFNLQVEAHNNNHNSFIGNVFDHLVRFYLASYKNASGMENILLYDAQGLYALYGHKSEQVKAAIKDLGRIHNTLYNHFSKTNENYYPGIKYIYIFLKLDYYIPSISNGSKTYNGIDSFEIDKEDIAEVDAMMKLFIEKMIKTEIIKKDSIIVLSPTFGNLLAPVSNSVADLYVDGMLIDLKSTINNRLDKSYIAQIFTYYVFDCFRSIYHEQNDEIKYNISGYNNSLLNNNSIDELAIYFSRFGELAKTRTNIIGNESLKECLIELRDLVITYKDDWQIDICKSRIGSNIDVQVNTERLNVLLSQKAEFEKKLDINLIEEWLAKRI